MYPIYRVDFYCVQLEVPSQLILWVSRPMLLLGHREMSRPAPAATNIGMHREAAHPQVR